MKKIQDKQIEGIIFKGGFCPFWGGGSIPTGVKDSLAGDCMVFQ